MRLHVPDMSCGHCIATIEKAVKATDPTAIIRPDLAAHTAEFETAVSSGTLTEILGAAGYPATVMEDCEKG